MNSLFSVTSPFDNRKIRTYPAFDAVKVAPSQREFRYGERQHCPQVFSNFRLSLTSLRLCGCYTAQYESKEPHVGKWFDKIPFWNLILTAILYFYATCHFITCILAAGTNHLWAAVSVFLQTIIALTTANTILTNESSLAALICRLKDFPDLPTHVKELRQYNIKAVLIGWLYLAVRIASGCRIIMMSSKAVQTYLVRHWFGINIGIDKSLVSEFLSMDYCLYTFLTTGCVVLSAALYLSLAVALRKKYDTFNATIDSYIQRDASHSITVHELQTLRQLQNDIGTSVIEMDSIFSKAAFSWTGLFVIGVCLEVTRFIGGRSDPEFEMQNEFLLLAINLLLYGGLFFLLAVTGSSLTEAAHASVLSAHRIINHSSDVDNEVFAQSHLLVSQMIKPTVGLTGWDFFMFSRGFVLTISGALVSYIIIIIQLNPTTKKTTQAPPFTTQSILPTLTTFVENITASTIN